jgi:Arc/MetJ family transcription regulator
MIRIVIEIDDQTFESAARWLGIKTKKDDVNRAPNVAIDRERRRAALERMRQMVNAGKIDFSVIEKRKPKKGKGRKGHSKRE